MPSFEHSDRAPTRSPRGDTAAPTPTRRRRGDDADAPTPRRRRRADADASPGRGTLSKLCHCNFCLGGVSRSESCAGPGFPAQGYAVVLAPATVASTPRPERSRRRRGSKTTPGTSKKKKLFAKKCGSRRRDVLPRDPLPTGDMAPRRQMEVLLVLFRPSARRGAAPLGGLGQPRPPPPARRGRRTARRPARAASTQV